MYATTEGTARYATVSRSIATTRSIAACST